MRPCSSTTKCPCCGTRPTDSCCPRRTGRGSESAPASPRARTSPCSPAWSTRWPARSARASPRRNCWICAGCLDPRREPGRLTLIARMGADAVADALPPLVEAVRRAGHPVIWLTDPLHGNTVTTPQGFKTRYVEAAEREVVAFHHAVTAGGGIAAWPAPGDDAGRGHGVRQRRAGHAASSVTPTRACATRGSTSARASPWCPPGSRDRPHRTAPARTACEGEARHGEQTGAGHRSHAAASARPSPVSWVNRAPRWPRSTAMPPSSAR